MLLAHTHTLIHTHIHTHTHTHTFIHQLSRVQLFPCQQTCFVHEAAIADVPPVGRIPRRHPTRPQRKTEEGGQRAAELEKRHE